MKKFLRLNLILLSAIFLFYGCEGLLEEDIIQEGSYMFWSNFDGPPIEVYIEGRMYGTITTFYSESPGCGSSGCVTITLEPGTYEMFAIEQSDGGNTPREWNDIFTIRPDVCGKKGLTAN